MEYLNAQLRQLQQKVARKKQLQARCDSLRSQRGVLLAKVASLDQMAMKEEADVARLEGRSLAAFFYNVVGKMDEKLDQERREAYAARVKYDAAVRELHAVELDLSGCDEELMTLSLCEEHFRMCLEEKAAAIKACGSPGGFEILRLETCLQTLECQMKELNEAVDAGNSALFTAKNIQAFLDNAQEMGTWDLFGGGQLADAGGHDHLDDAQSMVEKLQIQLRRLRTELTDVNIDADIQIRIEGFSRFADVFFDGLFADWTLMDQIQQARDQIGQTRTEIENILRKLDWLIDVAQSDVERCRRELDVSIVKA